MAVTVQQEVAALYSAIFNRAPDQEGLNNWVNLIQGGASLSQAAEGFVQHPVFTELYAGLTDIQFVQQLYINVLGSEGDAKGIQNWANLLASGVSKAQVVADFVSGALSVDLDAMLASGELTQAEYDAAVIRQDTLTNKANVGIYFADEFGAASNLNPATDTSTVAGLQADPAYLASQAAIANVTADAASVAAAKGRIDVAVKTNDPAGSLIGQNSELTAALAALSQANENLADFSNEVKAFQAANELTEDGLIETLKGQAQSALNTAADRTTDVSLNVAKGILADYNDALVQARQQLAAVQKEVDAVTDLNKALTAQQLAAEAGIALENANTAAGIAYAAADAASDAIESGAVYTYHAAPTAAGAPVVLVQVPAVPEELDEEGNVVIDAVPATPVVSIDASGNLVVATAYKNAVGINKLLEAVQAAQVAGAEAAVAASNKIAADAAYTPELVAVVGANTTLINKYGDAQDAVSNEDPSNPGFVEKISALEDAISLFEAVAGLNSKYNELVDARDDAQGVVEDLVDTFQYLDATPTAAATAEDDLFVFVDGDSTVSGFGQNGADLIFIGTNYAAGTGDFTKNEGNASVLEVFITQGATGAVVHVETKAFGSNAAGQLDVANITLTGVNAADLVFENGFVSFA